MTYEELQLQHSELNIKELDLSGVDGLKGLYVDGNIAIRKDMPSIEKVCILAEELGHHYTSYGNILDLSNVQNRKQETRARAWAYEKLLKPQSLIAAYEHGCKNKFEIAEFLNVTEDFLSEALEYYRRKYGVCAQIENYILYFEPNLGIIKLFD